MEKLFYAIVGNDTNTNEGLGRFVLAILAFIVVAGALFWLIG